MGNSFGNKLDRDNPGSAEEWYNTIAYSKKMEWKDLPEDTIQYWKDEFSKRFELAGGKVDADGQH